MSIFKCSESCSPFGMVMPGRQFNNGSYRYGYQGGKKDDEIAGNGNIDTTYYRGLDVRLNRWRSTDPVFQPWQSPYFSMDGNPILYNDPMGDKIRSKHTRSARRSLELSREEARNTTPDQIQTLFQQEYGINVKMENGWLMSDGDAATSQTISADARAAWLKGLDPNTRSSQKFKFFMNSSSVEVGGNNGTLSRIDLGDFRPDGGIRGDDYGTVPVRANNLARILEHEALGHGVNKLIDGYPSEGIDFSTDQGYGERPSETVQFVNNFRRQMNLPERLQYGSYGGLSGQRPPSSATMPRGVKQPKLNNRGVRPLFFLKFSNGGIIVTPNQR